MIFVCHYFEEDKTFSEKLATYPDLPFWWFLGVSRGRELKKPLDD
jgi:hypothetical protein